MAEFDAVVLFDLPFQSTIYRVFLLPGALQVDLSFTSEDEFGARSPRFRLLFGHAVECPASPPPSPERLFGLGVHYVTHAHGCIERGRLPQAEHSIHEARDQALTLACARLGLDVTYGRGFGKLPADVCEPLDGALVRELSAGELRRALAVATTGLLREARTMPDLVSRIRPGKSLARGAWWGAWWPRRLGPCPLRRDEGGPSGDCRAGLAPLPSGPCETWSCCGWCSWARCWRWPRCGCCRWSLTSRGHCCCCAP